MIFSFYFKNVSTIHYNQKSICEIINQNNKPVIMRVYLRHWFSTTLEPGYPLLDSRHQEVPSINFHSFFTVAKY